MALPRFPPGTSELPPLAPLVDAALASIHVDAHREAILKCLLESGFDSIEACLRPSAGEAIAAAAPDVPRADIAAFQSALEELADDEAAIEIALLEFGNFDVGREAVRDALRTCGLRTAQACRGPAAADAMAAAAPDQHPSDIAAFQLGLERAIAMAHRVGFPLWRLHRDPCPACGSRPQPWAVVRTPARSMLGGTDGVDSTAHDGAEGIAVAPLPPGTSEFPPLAPLVDAALASIHVEAHREAVLKCLLGSWLNSAEACLRPSAGEAIAAAAPEVPRADIAAFQSALEELADGEAAIKTALLDFMGYDDVREAVRNALRTCGLRTAEACRGPAAAEAMAAADHELSRSAIAAFQLGLERAIEEAHRVGVPLRRLPRRDPCPTCGSLPPPRAVVRAPAWTPFTQPLFGGMDGVDSTARDGAEGIAVAPLPPGTSELPPLAPVVDAALASIHVEAHQEAVVKCLLESGFDSIEACLRPSAGEAIAAAAPDVPRAHIAAFQSALEELAEGEAAIETAFLEFGDFDDVREAVRNALRACGLRTVEACRGPAAADAMAAADHELPRSAIAAFQMGLELATEDARAIELALTAIDDDAHREAVRRSLRENGFRTRRDCTDNWFTSQPAGNAIAAHAPGVPKAAIRKFQLALESPLDRDELTRRARTTTRDGGGGSGLGLGALARWLLAGGPFGRRGGHRGGGEDAVEVEDTADVEGAVDVVCGGAGNGTSKPAASVATASPASSTSTASAGDSGDDDDDDDVRETAHLLKVKLE